MCSLSQFLSVAMDQNFGREQLGVLRPEPLEGEVDLRLFGLSKAKACIVAKEKGISFALAMLSSAYMHDSVYSVKTGDLYFSDDVNGIQTVGTITEPSGLYPPYIPIISDKTSTTLTLLTGPSHHVEVRMRRVVASDKA